MPNGLSHARFPTSPVAMNWSAFIIAFGVAIIVGAFLEPRIADARPSWSIRRRWIAAASLLPALILFATILGLLWVLLAGPGAGENMQDLALVVTGAAGLLFSVLTLAAGFLGASVAGRRREP